MPVARKSWFPLFLVLTAFVILILSCGDGGGGPTEPDSPGSGSLSVTVTSAGVGLNGVTVSLSGPTTRSGTTNSSGVAAFQSLSVGSYSVTISGFSAEVSFSSTTKSASVTSGGSSSVTFQGNPVDYTLTVALSEGVTGTPPAGQATYPPGTTVDYAYDVASTHQDLGVYVDDVAASSSGTVVMSGERRLVALASPIPVVPPEVQVEVEELAEDLAGVTTGAATPMEAYRSVEAAVEALEGKVPLDSIPQILALARLSAFSVEDAPAIAQALQEISDSLAAQPAGSAAEPSPRSSSSSEIVFLYVNGLQTTFGGQQTTLRKYLPAVVHTAGYGNRSQYPIEGYFNPQAIPQSSSDLAALICLQREADALSAGGQDVGACAGRLLSTGGGSSLQEAYAQVLSRSVAPSINSWNAEALADRIEDELEDARVVLVTHSQGAQVASEAFGRLASRPGINPQCIGTVALGPPVPVQPMVGGFGPSQLFVTGANVRDALLTAEGSVPGTFPGIGGVPASTNPRSDFWNQRYQDLIQFWQGLVSSEALTAKSLEAMFAGSVDLHGVDGDYLTAHKSTVAGALATQAGNVLAWCVGSLDVDGPDDGQVNVALPSMTVRALGPGGSTAGQVSVPVTVSLGNNPSGATLSGTRVITTRSGVATFSDLVIDQAGEDYTLVVSVPGGVTATSEDFDVRGLPAPRITTTSLSTGTVGQSYSQTVRAEDGTTPYAWSISSGTLPAGLTFNASTGVISGTPTTAGTSNFTVMVTDANSLSDTKELGITISPAATPPTITTTSLADGTVGQGYSQTISATGGTTPYSWSMSSGTLPSGLTLNASTGVISGTPTTAGTSNFTVMVTDANSLSDTKGLGITINPAATPPTITTTSLPGGAVGQSYSQTISASGGTTPYSWSISSGTLPSGLTLNASTGVISGTPTTAGTSNFTVMVTDANSLSDTQDLSITVAEEFTGTYDCSTQSEIPAFECQALVALYDQTNGPGWDVATGWVNTTTPCSWYGVTCVGGSVTQLSFDDNNLTGSFPAELGNLANLTRLEIEHTQVTGPIPPEVGNLGSLTFLSFHTNNLTGSIPAELGNLSSLQHMEMDLNQLSGTIPAELGNLSALEEMSLDGNQLSGSIPPALGNLNALRVLALQNNLLSGSIPPELGNMSDLRWISLDDNNLTGSIPPALGNLANLSGLTVSRNQLSGAIPAALGDLANLSDLYLDENQFTGPIPSELGNLTELWYLELQDNQLSGSIPPELGNMSTLDGLNLSNNQLSGSIPPELGNLSSLDWMSLAGNQLSGPIPAELAGMTGLYSLTLVDNDLSGQVPLPVAHWGGQIEGWVVGPTNCSWVPPGNTGLFIPDTPEYRAADLTGDGLICGLTFGGAPTVLTVWLPDGTVGESYSQNVTASGGTTPYTWSISAGSLPAGLALNASSGEISGTPTTAGTSAFTVLVTDAGSLTDTQGLSITVTDGSYDCSAQAEIPTTECDALVALYEGTSGAGWTNSTDWVSTSTPCSWYGVTCWSGSVYALNLTSNQLAGPIPVELANLSGLQYLYLFDNQLSGNIPDEFANLLNLVRLELPRNQLTGPIPSGLGGLTVLERLNLSQNQISGSIPQELGTLPALTGLYLHLNQLSGGIPASLGSLSTLTHLYLTGNQLSGTIPAELWSLPNLLQLRLDGNQLTGTIPTEIGALSALEFLFLNENQFSGGVPNGLGSLANLKMVNLSGNQMAGILPNAVAQMGGAIQNAQGSNYCIFTPPGNTALGIPDTQGYRDADLDSDGFICGVALGSAPIVTTTSLTAGFVGQAYSETVAATDGTTPYSWAVSNGTLPAGLTLNASTGEISGTPSAAGLFTFTVMVTDAKALSDTKELSIEVTSGLYNCSAQSEIPTLECEALVALYEDTNGPGWTNSTNWISNTTPCNWNGVWCSGGSVIQLTLNFNELTGTIPPELGDLSNLNVLGLQGNPLTGSIPPELGSLTNLRVLDLYTNQLTGSIPATLGDLSSLEELYLAENQLSGPIPPELGNAPSLEYLYLHDNQLSGSIPAELGNLNLWELPLYNNQLTGPIPAELGNLTNLFWLWIQGNQLSGDVPVSVFQLGGGIQSTSNEDDCIFTPPGNEGLTIPYSQEAVAADWNSDWKICGVQIGTAPTITTTALPPGEIGQPYTATVEATGGVPPYRWSAGGVVPIGQLSGEISFTPSAVGTLAFTVGVTGENGLSDSRELSIEVAGSSYDCSAQSEIPTTECEALVALHNETGGPLWGYSTGWVSTPTPCSWHGVTCSGGSVSQLALGSNYLGGTIPAGLGSLTGLTYLNLYRNSLSGPIPPGLGTLANLETLALSENELTGSIPSSFGALANLQVLSLATNQLTGTIPAELGDLSNLAELYLSNNQLSGSIPAGLGSLGSLWMLDLQTNQLTGAIPAELGSMSSLARWYVQNNGLSGAIPLAAAQLGGLIQNVYGTGYCVFLPPGNTSLTIPDTQDYRDADLDADGFICGVSIGSE